MKKIIAIALVLSSAAGWINAQGNKDIRLGLMSGIYGNHSEYSGGMSNAPSEFSHDPYGTGSFDLTLRYDYNHRWAFMSGIGFTSAGFNFTLANDYSLQDECTNRYDIMESSLPVVDIPVMALIKTNNNCRNWRWVFGAGVVNSFVGKTNYDNSVVFSQEQEQNAEFMSVSTRSQGGYHLQSRFLIGREKQFTRGAILTFMLVINKGYSDIGTAEVTYNQDNRLYNHEFTNQGSFCGFSIAYSFRPLSHKVATPQPADRIPLKAL